MAARRVSYSKAPDVRGPKRGDARAATLSAASDFAHFFRQGVRIKRRPVRPATQDRGAIGPKRLASLSLARGQEANIRRRLPRTEDNKKLLSLSSVSKYLSEFSLALETRYLSGATAGIVYLKDHLLNTAAPASFFGRSFLPGGAMRPTKQKSAPLNPRIAAYRDALRISHNGRTPSYSGWLGIRTGLPASLSRKVGLAYVVSGGVGYIGRPGADQYSPLECASERGKTIRTLYKYLYDAAVKSGKNPPELSEFLELQPQEQDNFLREYFIIDDLMTPRTPVLLRDTYLVRAIDVSPALSARSLTEAYGETFSDFWERNETSSKKNKQAEIEFLSTLKVSPVPENGPDVGFGGIRLG